MAQEPIWPGSGSAVSGNTPFGTYDTDSDLSNRSSKVCQLGVQKD